MGCSFPLITGHEVWPTSDPSTGIVWSLEVPVMVVFFLAFPPSKWMKGSFGILVRLTGGWEKATSSCVDRRPTNRVLSKKNTVSHAHGGFGSSSSAIFPLHHRPYCIIDGREMDARVLNWPMTHRRGRCQAWNAINGGFGGSLFWKRRNGKKVRDEMLTGFGVWVFRF